PFPFSAQVTQSRAYQDSPLLEFSLVSSKPDEASATLLNPKSPVMTMCSTLSLAFYWPSHASTALKPTRVFTPSRQSTQLEAQPRESLSPAVLRRGSSTIFPGFIPLLHDSILLSFLRGKFLC
ncbi:hypothetical protein VP01_2954g2, partial [Puccinia sorghi]